MIDCSAWRRLSCSPPVTSTHSSTTPVLWRHCSLACPLGACWSCASHALILNDRLRWVVLGVFPSKTALSILVVILDITTPSFPLPPQKKRKKEKRIWCFVFLYILFSFLCYFWCSFCLYPFLFFQVLWACSVNVEGFDMLYELPLHYTALQYSLFCMETDIGQFLYILWSTEATTWINQASWSFGYVYICLCADHKPESRSVVCRQQIQK